jgi:hypothetical protein
VWNVYLRDFTVPVQNSDKVIVGVSILAMRVIFVTCFVVMILMKYKWCIFLAFKCGPEFEVGKELHILVYNCISIYCFNIWR